MNPPPTRFARPLKGAMRADRQSRIRRILDAAARVHAPWEARGAMEH
ncbi:hypothetical protein GCM10023144_29560 [Pigmentiphaga soli]|uniref:Uncharacterized protein n=1 Tax=Pigmentiphaga soli TaxID=1007095 RepID=A0ABP8H8Q8_9BURK